jgi:hypothetical protein
MDPTASLDMVAKREKPHHCPYRESNLDRVARSLVTILTQRLKYTKL